MIKKIKKIPKFFREVKEELKKVNWSTRQELVAAGILVVVVAIILTSYIFMVDIGLSRLVQLVLK
jgi:preprotein translocase subunit SecE|tara:strand:- start:253 stop:447 length:195 start_codon:yes stop_codon:yes gene_type:complete